MATNIETVSWAAVYQIETTDPVLGGVGGIANLPAVLLGNRDAFLKSRQDAIAAQAGMTPSDSDTVQSLSCTVLHVASAAAIPALPVPQVSSPREVVLITRGIAANGDGASRVYRWNSTSNAAHDGFATIIPSGNPALGRWRLLPPDPATVEASLLAGQAAAFYLNANNLNAGTVPSARLGTGTADATTYLRGDRVWSTVNAVTLGGQSSTFFQNASNLNAGVAAPARLGTGSPTTANWLRGDGVWSTVDASSLNGQAAGFYLNASNLATGTVPTARLGSGTANGTTYLRGDSAWGPVDAQTLQGNQPSAFFNAGNLNAGIIPVARVSQAAVTQHAAAIKGQNLSGRAGTAFTIAAGSGPPNLSGSTNGDLFGFY